MITILTVVVLAMLAIGAVWFRDLLKWTRRTDATLETAAQLLVTHQGELMKVQRHAVALERSLADVTTALSWTTARLLAHGVLGPDDRPPVTNHAEVRH